MARMTDDELIAVIEAYEEQSYGFDDGELQEERETAIRAFNGEQLIPSAEGRSAINSTVTRDCVLWIMPNLLRIFLGGDQVVEFRPESEEDEEQAKQESEVISWISERSEPFVQLHSMFFDALLCKNGYAKVFWEKNESVEVERYQGKSDDELAFLMQDSDIEIVEHDQYPDPQWMPPPPQMVMDPATGQPVPQPVPPQPMLHDVVCKRTVVDEYPRFVATPPEEVRVVKSATSVSLREVEFVEHRTRLSLSKLREMGYDVPDDLGDWYDDDDDEYSARDRFSEDDIDPDDKTDPAARKVTYRECYALVDVDKDGKSERVKVCVVGRKVLHWELTDHVPIVSISPVLFPHRHIGVGEYDLTKELEAISTVIKRSFLDGLYLSLNQRTAVDAGAVNIDDMLVVRSGGLVRTNGSPLDKIMPMPVQPVGDISMQAMSMVDQWIATATGQSSMTQMGPGMDANALNNVAGVAMSQAISQAMMRIEAIARSFSETGIKDLFLLMHQLMLKHSRKAMTVKLRNKWVPVDPSTWRKRNTVECKVALGAGTKEVRAAQLQNLLNTQMQMMPTGVVQPKNLYATAERLANELGYKNADQFFTNPDMVQPQQPPPDPLVLAQQIKSDSDLKTEQMRLAAKGQDDQRKAILDHQQAALKAELDRTNAENQAALERFKAQVKADADITVAKIKAEIDAATAIQIEEMKLRAQGITVNTGTQMQEHAQGMAGMMQQMQQIGAAVEAMAQELARAQQPRQIVRDARGKVVGTAGQDGQMTHHVVRDANGRAAGIAPANKLQ